MVDTASSGDEAVSLLQTTDYNLVLTDLHMEGNLDQSGVGQALDAIERNAWLQSRLIDDLLHTSRIAAGKLHFETRPADLRSERVGQGAEFQLTIARVKNAGLATEAAPAKELSLAGLEVLIVEDSSDTLSLLNTLFTHEGASVTSLASATQALISVKIKRPHLTG